MTITATAKDVVKFWDHAGPQAWYKQDDAFDQAIRDQFGAAWQDAHDGTLADWSVDAHGALGLIILLDQFPRNMFRNDPRAFSTDAQAIEAAKKMVAQDWDTQITGAMRQFIYMPFMHSEGIADQDMCIDLMETRMGAGSNALHARVHREIIARFGRFPYRNGPLGRDTAAAEQDFLDNGGYGAILREIEAAS